LSQANVYFELGRTDAATIEGLSPRAEAIEMQKLPKGFLDERDSGSALTFFLVRKATNGGAADNGATNANRSVGQQPFRGGHPHCLSGAAGTVGKYDATTGAVINVNFITRLSDPEGLAVLGIDLFVGNHNFGSGGAGSVGEYDATTGAAINANFITGLTGP
jgi:hypothetical protein